MAANLTTHLPIIQVQQKAGTTPFTSSQPEYTGQTFLSGTPVALNSSGFVIAWPSTGSPTGTILGIAESFGQNLGGAAGAYAPAMPFGQITGSGAIATYGSVPNEPNAVNIALGTPVADGRTLYMEANQDSIFQALFDDSAASPSTANYTPTQADIGATFGLTKDANGLFYVDRNVTGTSSPGAVIQIVALPFGSYVNAPVNFVFLTTAIQVA